MVDYLIKNQTDLTDLAKLIATIICATDQHKLPYPAGYSKEDLVRLQSLINDTINSNETNESWYEGEYINFILNSELKKNNRLILEPITNSIKHPLDRLNNDDLIVIPYLLNGNHWNGILIDQQSKQISYFDPFGVNKELVDNQLDINFLLATINKEAQQIKDNFRDYDDEFIQQQIAEAIHPIENLINLRLDIEQYLESNISDIRSYNWKTTAKKLQVSNANDCGVWSSEFLIHATNNIEQIRDNDNLDQLVDQLTNNLNEELKFTNQIRALNSAEINQFLSTVNFDLKKYNTNQDIHSSSDLNVTKPDNPLEALFIKLVEGFLGLIDEYLIINNAKIISDYRFAQVIPQKRYDTDQDIHSSDDLNVIKPYSLLDVLFIKLIKGCLEVVSEYLIDNNSEITDNYSFAQTILQERSVASEAIICR